MCEYRVIYEDPLYPEECAKVLCPAQEWIEEAMAGNLPPIWVYWNLMDAEEQAKKENRHDTFCHNEADWMLQFTAPRIGPLTEEEAIEYLIMKDIPRRVWGEKHNKPMFAIVNVKDIPSDRTFRNAWRMPE